MSDEVCRGAGLVVVEERPGRVVTRPQGPAAALESVSAVHIRRAVSLHHSIDGYLRHGRPFHDRESLLLGRPGRRLPPATNAAAPIRHRPPETLPRNFRYAGQRSEATALHLLMRAQCGRALGPDGQRTP